MPQQPVPLPPPEETAGKLEGISRKLIPYATVLFLLSLGYYFSIFFINREIRVREIKSSAPQTGDISPSPGVSPGLSPAISGFSGESSPLPGSTTTATDSSPRDQNNEVSMERTPSPTPQPLNSTVKGTSHQGIYSAGNTTPTPSPSPIPFHKKINLNTAKADDFTNLPGLGVKKSMAIIEYRRNSGPFKTTEDIMKVKGIGKKLYEKIRPWIFVE